MSRMNRWTAVQVAVFAGVCGLSGVASAQPTVYQRCAADGLNPAQADARLEWVRQCALSKLRPTDGWDTGAPAANGGNLIEYTEPSSDPLTGRDAYTGLGDYTDINTNYLYNMYRSGPTYQSLDARGYYKWTRAADRKKPRSIYPIYGTQSDINNALALFPHPTLANCSFYYDRNGTRPASVSFYLNAYCESDGSQLTSGTPVTVSGAVGSTTTYMIYVPAGASRVLFETSGGTGDVDIYVRYNATPTLSTYDCRPYRSGNTEACETRSPGAGSWYVMLHGYAAYAGVTLKATVY